MAEEMKMTESAVLAVNEMTIGAFANAGGSRGKVIRVGGQKALPFLFKEGSLPHRPVIAAEVLDVADPDWPGALTRSLSNVMSDPVAWSRRMVEESGADMVCLRLPGTHPDVARTNLGGAVDLVRRVLSHVKVPLMILGSGDASQDNDILPMISEVTRGERLIFGDALPENYKTLAAACIADGHNIIAESPIDVNIAKQLNILLTDLGVPADRIAINPTIGALGYGLEYAYSIMERARLAALSGDKMLAMPFVCFVGPEVWKVKEVRGDVATLPQGGDPSTLAVMWEATTAMAMVHAGADILTMTHPTAIRAVRRAIDDLVGASCL